MSLYLTLLSQGTSQSSTVGLRKKLEWAISVQYWSKKCSWLSGDPQIWVGMVRPAGGRRGRRGGKVSTACCVPPCSFIHRVFSDPRMHVYTLWLPSWLVVKNLPASAGDMGSIPGLRTYPEEGNGNPLRYSCLRNPMDRGAWQAKVHGVTRSCIQLNN